jgi:ABC-type Zn uptake system ZnuABC Zn-binding protein ZnuA
MDPHNAILWTYLVRDTLSELDPANAEIYAANADAYAAELATLADETFAALDAIPMEQRVFITNHQSFGYITNAIGVEFSEPIISGGSTLAQPDARTLSDLIEVVEETGVRAVFAETIVNTQFADTIANEANVEVYTLYTGSLSDADGPAATYIDLIRTNTATIVEALTTE